MSTGQTPLVCFLTLALRLNIVTAAVSGCPVNADNERPPCNETCSKPPRITHGGSFVCSVGYDLEWKDFRNRYEFERATVLNSSISDNCKVPVMSKISLYALPYKETTQFSTALNITFDLSFIGKQDKPELKAVLLHFHSPASEKLYTDFEYAAEGRNRLFNFDSYQPDSYDWAYPITIDYLCLYGLDDCSREGRVYTISLTALTMDIGSGPNDVKQEYFKCTLKRCFKCSLNYTISTYPARYQMWNKFRDKAFVSTSEEWNMTIATALFPTLRDIHILLEQPKFKFDYYTIRLVTNGHAVRVKNTLSSKDTSYTFHEVPVGSYKVQVELCCNLEQKKEYTTYHSIVIADSNPKKTADPSNLPAIIAPVSGTILAILLLAILAWVRCKKDKVRNDCIEDPKYIILYNDDVASDLMSEHLKNAVSKLAVSSVVRTKKFETKHVAKNLFVLILLPVDHKSFHFKITNEIEYEQIVESVLRKKLSNVLLVYFPFMEGAKRVRWEFLKNCKRISLMKECGKMINLLKIKNNDKRLLNKVISDLHSATEEAKKLLMTCQKTPEALYPSNDSIDSLCAVHNPPQHPVKTDCPVHQHHNRTKFYLQDELPVLHNNELETFAIIPPSPMPSIKGRKEPFAHNSSGSSGYVTFILPSSSDNPQLDDPNSLEDDESIHEAIKQINKPYLQEHNVMETDRLKPYLRDQSIMEMDPLLDVNFL